MYAVFVFLILEGLRRNKGRYTTPEIVKSVVLAVVFGVAMEALQAVFKQGRHFEVMDIIANISGTFIGAASFLIIRKKRNHGN